MDTRHYGRQNPPVAEDDELARLLSAWTADHLEAESARSRSRRHWAARMLAEESDLASVLLDLADSGAEVTVRTRGGRCHRGRIIGARRDYLAVQAAPGTVLVRLAAVTTVEPGGRMMPGGRRDPADGDLAAALGASAGTGAPVVVRLAGGEEARGEIALVSGDFVALEPWTEERAWLYLPLEAVEEVLFISG